MVVCVYFLFFFFQAEDGIRDWSVTGVQTCALPISFYFQRGGLDERAGLEEIERREQCKRDDADAVRQVGIALKGGGQRHADHIGWQHGFAADRCGKSTEREQDEQQELDLWLAHPTADLGEEPGRD